MCSFSVLLIEQCDMNFLWVGRNIEKENLKDRAGKERELYSSWTRSPSWNCPRESTPELISWQSCMSFGKTFIWFKTKRKRKINTFFNCQTILWGNWLIVSDHCSQNKDIDNLGDRRLDSSDDAVRLGHKIWRFLKTVTSPTRFWGMFWQPSNFYIKL